MSLFPIFFVKRMVWFNYKVLKTCFWVYTILQGQEFPLVLTSLYQSTQLSEQYLTLLYMEPHIVTGFNSVLAWRRFIYDVHSYMYTYTFHQIQFASRNCKDLSVLRCNVYLHLTIRIWYFKYKEKLKRNWTFLTKHILHDWSSFISFLPTKKYHMDYLNAGYLSARSNSLYCNNYDPFHLLKTKQLQYNRSL